jgi:hypothetical protein
MKQFEQSHHKHKDFDLKQDKHCWGNLPQVPRAAGYGPKILNAIGSLQWHAAGEPYTPYQEAALPLAG